MQVCNSVCKILAFALEEALPGLESMRRGVFVGSTAQPPSPFAILATMFISLLSHILFNYPSPGQLEEKIVPLHDHNLSFKITNWKQLNQVCIHTSLLIKSTTMPYSNK